jgi:hypothetical protein
LNPSPASFASPKLTPVGFLAGVLLSVSWPDARLNQFKAIKLAKLKTARRLFARLLLAHSLFVRIMISSTCKFRSDLGSPRKKSLKPERIRAFHRTKYESIYPIPV